MGKIYQVVVHGLRGEKLIVDLCNTEEQMQSMTVLQLKQKIAQKLPDTLGKSQTAAVWQARASLRDDVRGPWRSWV